MTDYRLYCLDGAHKVSGAADWVEAKTDNEAIIVARAMKLQVSCELWHRDRRVAEIAAYMEHAG